MKSAYVLTAFTLMIIASWASTGSALDAENWQLDPKVMYLVNSASDNGAGASQSRFLGEFMAGYKFAPPIFLGGLVDYDGTTSTGTATTHDTYTSGGPTFGLMTENVAFLVTYFAWTQYQFQDSTGVTTYGNGSGFQAELSYVFTFGDWGFGPCLAYRSLHYSNVTTPAGASSGADHSFNTFVPYIAFQFEF